MSYTPRKYHSNKSHLEKIELKKWRIFSLTTFNELLEMEVDQNTQIKIINHGLFTTLNEELLLTITNEEIDGYYFTINKNMMVLLILITGWIYNSLWLSPNTKII